MERMKGRRKKGEDLADLIAGAIDSMQLGVTITDMNGRILYTNAAEARMHGYEPEELVGNDARIFAPRELWKTMPPEQIQELGSWKRESANVRENGRMFPVQIFSDVIADQDGNPIGVVTVCEDITERQMAQHAFYDTLTGLPNRALFMDRLGRSIKRIKRRRDYLFAVLYLDLDRFKLVNDMFGQITGDRLLNACGRRLEKCLRFGDTVARLGGDKFGILLEDISDFKDAEFIAERVQKQLSSPFDLDGQELNVTASVGIARGTSGYDRPEDLVRDADSAMYRAKGMGRERVEIFDALLHIQEPQLALEKSLRQALEQNQLLLHYQPVVSLEDGKVAGAEVLLRWNQPERGIVHPDEFIPVAEETGVIASIGEWVLRSACTQNMIWQQAGLPPVYFSLNLSIRQLETLGFIELVARILLETGMDPSLLQLELSERLAMERMEKLVTPLAELKAMGIRISIDNFGTGFSSLGHLKRFHIDTLKIDRSFVRDLGTDPKNDAFASAVIALAHSLKMKVVAEGVETEEQLTFLRWHHCDEIQGYLFSPPLTVEDLTRLLEEKRRLQLK